MKQSMGMTQEQAKACLQLNEQLRKEDWQEALWQAVLAFEGTPFWTARGLEYSYVRKAGRHGMPTEELVFDRKEKTITRATVNLAFANALAVQTAEGYVKGPKRLGVFGASYLYPLFLRFGVITRVRPS